MDQTTVHDTFVITRTYPKEPAIVFSAFADTAKKRHWFAEGEKHDVEAFEMDFREGGAERVRYKLKEGTPFSGVSILNEGYFQDIVPNRRVVTSSTMTFGDQRISASLVTFEFLPTEAGTELVFTHQGIFFEGSDGPKIRQAGWNSLLDKFGKEISAN